MHASARQRAQPAHPAQSCWQVQSADSLCAHSACTITHADLMSNLLTWHCQPGVHMPFQAVMSCLPQQQLATISIKSKGLQSWMYSSQMHCIPCAPTLNRNRGRPLQAGFMQSSSYTPCWLYCWWADFSLSGLRANSLSSDMQARQSEEVRWHSSSEKQIKRVISGVPAVP